MWSVLLSGTLRQSRSADCPWRGMAESAQAAGTRNLLAILYLPRCGGSIGYDYKSCLADHVGRERSLFADGGVGGIRTLGTAFQPYNGLANRRLQPLGHHSRCIKCRKIKSRSCSRFVNKATVCNSVCSFYQASANWATRDFIAISQSRKLLLPYPLISTSPAASARVGRDLMSVCCLRWIAAMAARRLKGPLRI